MSPTRFVFSFLVILVATLTAEAQTVPPIVEHAKQHVAKNPDVRRQVGLAELLRSHSLKQASIDELRKAARSDALAVEVQALLCWRMLPAAEKDRAALRVEIARLKTMQPSHPWIHVWELYLAAGESNRPALLALANRKLPAIEAFPLAFAEQAHADLLQELGWSRLQAGMEVISARGYEPLHALREVDRVLKREADFLQAAGREADANRLDIVRLHYQKAYPRACRHLVEKLFALHLLGQAQERDALLARAKAIPYLHDRQRLASLLERLDEEQAWKLVIEPLLKSELALIDNPPELAPFKPRSVAQVKINARKKTVHDRTVRYEGDVRFRLHGADISCEQLTLVPGDDAGATMLTTEKVEVRGFTQYPLGITADRLLHLSETGTFSLSGDVRLRTFDKTVKLRFCTLTPQGELRDAKSWLDDFQNAFDFTDKITLLPNITRVYQDSELPDEVRFILALHTLSPHLTWRGPYLPPLPGQEKWLLEEARVKRELRDEVAWKRDESAWQPALGAERWMLRHIPQSAKDAFEQAMKDWYRLYAAHPQAGKVPPPDLPHPDFSAYFWRIRDPRHADVARAVRLLQDVTGEKHRREARRWAAEIERNNTVLTFDIPGAAVAGKPHYVVMDARNAEQVSFKLYRVKQPDELLYAANRVGKDFLYRDYGLDEKGLRKMMETMAKAGEALEKAREDGRDGRDELVPVWKPEHLVHQWNVQVADLPALNETTYSNPRRWRWRFDDHDEDTDAHYFDDDCGRYRARLDKRYRSEHRYALSSWQCDRVVRIPEKALAESGAYVLRAESNGQVVYVPIVVDPLSLTLRRCRDGLFVLASEPDGMKPIEGAQVYARGMVGEARTDREGVAFARVLAFGDRPILVHHQGRYAIGGFGKIFEGIYEAADEEDDYHHRRLRDVLKKAREQMLHPEGLVFADQHVVIAYTDRPTYRPGQEVQFKLIVRKQVPEADKGTATFRGAEFDSKMKLVLPNLDQELAYHILDPKGHVVADGVLKLNDFGTAAGKIALNSETVLGAYSFRIRIAGEPRLVPEVFTVKHYRRPAFEVDVTGVPEKLTKPRNLALKLKARYYFGSPVAGGRIEVRVQRQGNSRTIAGDTHLLDAQGEKDLDIDMPGSLAAGKYLVTCSITDESGRTVSKTLPLEIDSPAERKRKDSLADLPRFVPVGAELKITTAEEAIWVDGPEKDIQFHVSAKVGKVKLEKPGWYHLRTGEERSRDGDDETLIFAYGGNEHPMHYERKEQEKEDGVQPAWVNLSDYAEQENGHLSRWEKPTYHLHALFDRQQASAGDRLKLLVYVPHKKAKLLFTIEGRTILDYVVLWSSEKAGAYQIVEIPIKDRYFPNVYLQGRILVYDEQRVLPEAGQQALEQRKALERLEAEGEDPRWCRIDVLKPKQKHEAGSLDVRIETNQPSYRPGEAVQATIKVTDRAGRPQSAELSLATIDESVYAFGEDRLDALPGFLRSPNQPRFFLPKVWRASIGNKWSQKAKGQLKEARAMQQQAAKQAEQLLKQMRASELHELKVHHLTAVPLPQLGGELPIGNIPAARLREHFHETATWVPQIRTDERGIAKVAFTLPDSLTRYRLTGVALTKDTEIGVGRAHITAGLPLAVQVFLPRFAVERDRLQAVAVIHNSTDQPRDCQIHWQVQGATAEFPVPIPQEWKPTSEQGQFSGTGRVRVPAKSATKIGLWLKLERMGSAKVVFRAQGGKDADAEVRTLPIYPLGQPREFDANDTLAQGPRRPDDKHGTIKLPPGFVPRELDVRVTCSELGQAMEGLDYLVDYPYGCIEQTMSRFLPATMVKHATQHAPITLHPDIAAKLPDVLEKGLTRVYGFQHPDGSWGWFAKDSQNNPMTVYVLYGLARCKATGTQVDENVLKRGCQYLRQELQTKRLDANLAARAWYVLALAGHADAKEVEAYSRRVLLQDPRLEACCNLALACRVLGVAEVGEQLWAKASAWQPHTTEMLALKLNTQLAYGAPYEACGNTARELLARREGMRWYHTRDTSWAVEALSNMLGYIPDKGEVRSVQVKLGDKTILDIREPRQLRTMSYRVRLTGDQIPLQEGPELTFKADSSRMLFVSVRAVGIQRHDELKASGTRIKLTRTLETLNAEPLRGPVKVGEAFRVRLRLELDERQDYLLIEERRPALCEFADDRIDGGAARSAVHQEWRDDRLAVFFTTLSAGTHEIVYYLRAETPGDCTMLTGCAYPMYNEKTRGETGANKIEVKAP